MDFSWLLKHSQFSDCTLMVCAGHDGAECKVRICYEGTNGSDVLAQYPVHRVILATASPYFKTLFDEKWSGPAHPVVTILIDKHETAAAEIMLNYIYSGTLPEGEEEKLFTCMILANRYQVDKCACACAEKLCYNGPSCISEDLMLKVLSLPAVLRGTPEFRTLLHSAQSKLAHIYADLELAWQSAGLRRMFVQLPFDAVKFLLSRSDVKVASESVVFVAVTSWILANKPHEAYNMTEIQELLDCMRLVHLSTTFLCDIAHNIKTFTDFETYQLGLRKAMQYRLCSFPCKSLLAQSMHTTWLEAREKSAVDHLEFVWDLSHQELRQALAEGQHRNWYSDYYYYAGVFWRLNVCVQPADMDLDISGNASPGMDIFVGVGWESMFESSDVRSVGTLAMRVRFAISDVYSHRTVEDDVGEGTIDDGEFYGDHHFFGFDVYTDENAWNPFVSQGKIRLKCTVLECE